MARRLRILVADANKANTDFVRHLLDPVVEVVGGVEDGASLLDAATRLRPDVVIASLDLPVLSAIDASLELGKGSEPPKIILLVSEEEPALLEKALAAGASGYVLQSSVVTDLKKAVMEATQGRTFISRSREGSRVS
jgi:DNA-binding NarL/FixJ family response regulator